ncbi:hypothetical protein Cthiooxydans_30920 [Comamonas thiooxydans]|nr:hypothetical protein Cthiooxydans_30920 [Comamonas thiooxydans]
MRPMLATPVRTATNRRLIIETRREAADSAKYGKAKQRHIKGGISGSKKESTQRKQYLRWVLFESK